MELAESCFLLQRHRLDFRFEYLCVDQRKQAVFEEICGKFEENEFYQARWRVTGKIVNGASLVFTREICQRCVQPIWQHN